MSGPASASVVVCAYTERRWDTLLEAVTAAAAQDPLEVLLVVDHAPALETRARAALPGVRVLANTGAQGLSGARNTGVAAARGDVVAFLDDDAVPEPGWLATLLAPLADPSVTGAGGSALPRWEAPRPGWIPDELLWVVGCSYTGQPVDVRPIRNPIGANMAFRRSAFDVAGGFTDGIGRVGRVPLGGEETEFAIRLRQARPDTIVVQVPAARVRHLVPADRARWSYFRRRCWAEGISKALIARRVGGEAALEAERAYVRRVLPAAVARDLAVAARGDAAALGRAACVVAALAVTAAGYARGCLVRP